MKKSQIRDTLTQLRAKHPDWYIWYDVVALGRIVWFAGKPSGMSATFEAHSPEGLDADLSNETLTSS